jgi:hypothetical protein
MIHWRRATVRSVLSDRPGAREVEAELHAPLPRPDGAARDGALIVRALAYTDLVGAPEPGDAVLLNVSALARRLGTGGFALVTAIPDRLPADPAPGPGHLVKDRYSPLQTMVLGVDDQESPHHTTLAEAAGIDGTPVIVADLHSALPAIIAGVRAERPEARIAYVMTDGAALPLAFSQAVAGLKEAGWLHTTVTVGQAHGGDLEAVTVHTGLLAAVHVARADVVVVAQGPGNLGTGTPYGFSGLVVGDHLNAAALLGGTPIAALRMSEADARERHLGISHHTLTAVGRVARPGHHRDGRATAAAGDRRTRPHRRAHRRPPGSTAGVAGAPVDDGTRAGRGPDRLRGLCRGRQAGRREAPLLRPAVAETRLL